MQFSGQKSFNPNLAWQPSEKSARYYLKGRKIAVVVVVFTWGPLKMEKTRPELSPFQVWGESRLVVRLAVFSWAIASNPLRTGFNSNNGHNGHYPGLDGVEHEPKTFVPFIIE